MLETRPVTAADTDWLSMPEPADCVAVREV